MNLTITTEVLPAEGIKTSWASGVIIAEEPILYETTVYSVGEEAVSQWQQVGEGYSDYETTDYLTGKIYQNLFKSDARHLAGQIACAYAYNSH